MSTSLSQIEEEEKKQKETIVSIDMLNAAKADIAKYKAELTKLESRSQSNNGSRNARYTQYFSLYDKQSQLIWSPFDDLKADGDYVDYGTWRFILKSVRPEDKKAYDDNHSFQIKAKKLSPYYNKGYDPSNEYNGLCLLLTRTSKEASPDWLVINPNTKKEEIMEIPLSHTQFWKYAERNIARTQQSNANLHGIEHADFSDVCIDYGFKPYIEFSVAMKTQYSMRLETYHDLVNNMWYVTSDLEYYKKYPDQHRLVLIKYFEDLANEIIEAQNIFKKKRTNLLTKISKNNTIVEAFNAGVSVEEYTGKRKQVREEKILENKGKKLGKEFEQFAKLAVELSKFKDLIQDLEKEIASDDCKLNHANFERRMQNVSVGYQALKSFFQNYKEK